MNISRWRRSMADWANIPVPQARYSLLLDPTKTRKGFFERNKWILFALSSCLMLLTTLWLMFVHVNSEGLLYPHDRSLKRIPEHWIRRAVKYSSFNQTTYNRTIDFNLDVPQNVTPSATEFKLVCYYALPAEAEIFLRLYPEGLNASLCTHINIAFATIRNNSIYLNPKQAKNCRAIVDLKLENPDLQVLISVGGAGDVNGFIKMVLNHANRKQFIKSVLDLMKEFKFDGVDLDWEFPGNNSTERMHFTQLLHEIREEIDRQEKHRFLLTVAVGAPIFIIDTSYDVSYINRYVDFVNLMSYDYHFYTKVTPFTGMNSPLYARDDDFLYLATMNINYSAHYWLHKGLDREKLVIGLPTYGHSFRLINSANNGIMAPCHGYGNLGLNGFTSYSEVCMFLSKNKITPIFDMDTRSPYATRNHEWVSYDDLQSITYKTEYVRNNNFGGVMLFALNTDDHKGVCDGKTKFPLTWKVKEVLERKNEMSKVQDISDNFNP
ncbi:PREDICTED: chitinase-3-like protein 2 isoform X2 [Nicrophorus vespilloides]|uniref:Chitinase-3-like protein 2 isoform X2 n=1 Tax=Nicrophorus vespilloides TaxID=110193 RepID=A0ABM1M8H7_NICVS|nr:PREDICTED: chitinase-3-like protein 2 isoform X2 [Nicrophorus vespilloides]